MPKFLKAEELSFTSGNTKEQAAYNAYLQQCAEAVSSINVESLEDYDPFAVPEEERTAFDKLLMVIKTLEQTRPDDAADIKTKCPPNAYQKFGNYKNLITTAPGFAAIYGDMIQETVRRMNECIYEDGDIAMGEMTEEQQKLLNGFAELFLPVERTLDEREREKEAKGQPEVGEEEPEAPRQSREPDGLAPETVKPAVQEHAEQAISATIRLMDTEAHTTGSDAYMNMRNSVNFLDSSKESWAETNKEQAVKDCLAYIRGKESQRWTQSGRERFQAAMTTLGALLSPEDFQKEIDRVNRVRAGRWFGLGGPQLRAQDFTSEKAISDLSKAAKGLNDYYTDCETCRRQALDYARKKDAEWTHAYLSRMVADCELGGENGFTRISEERENELVNRANEIIGGEGLYSKWNSGLSYLANELTEKPELAKQLLGDGNRDPMQIGRAVADKAADCELSLVTRSCADVMEQTRQYMQGEEPSRSNWLSIEDQLAKLTAAGLLARDREDGKLIDLRSREGGGRALLEQRTKEVKTELWFKAVMAELTAPADKLGGESLLNGTKLPAIIEQARAGKTDALLSAHDRAKELNETLSQRAEQYDVMTWRKVKLGSGQVVGTDTPAGQLQLAVQKAREARASERAAAATELLAARLTADRYKDALLQADPAAVELKKKLMEQIQKSPNRQNPNKTQMDLAIEQCHDAVKAVKLKSSGQRFLDELGKAVKEQDMGSFMNGVSAVAQGGRDINLENRKKLSNKENAAAPK